MSDSASQPLRFVMLGLAITSSRDDARAATFRGLVRALGQRGHDVLVLEWHTSRYAAQRDLPDSPLGRTCSYTSAAELQREHAAAVGNADVVVVGSHVPDGIASGEWVLRTARGVTAFYDIDTPLTLARLEQGTCAYLSPQLIPRYQLYLSLTGGLPLERLEREYGSPAARALLCSVDPDAYAPEAVSEPVWDLGYLGTYGEDRQATLERLMLTTARRWDGGRFVAAGPDYPARVRWPRNVERVGHVPPQRHRHFFCQQRFTLHVTRAATIGAGDEPSERLFEAAACGTPIISDASPGLETVFAVGREILIARSPQQLLELLVDLPEAQRRALGERARARVLREHTAAHRAAELEAYVLSLRHLEPAA